MSDLADFILARIFWSLRTVRMRSRTTVSRCARAEGGRRLAAR